ncbi:hypothetical protein CJF42_24090 [Pseudoalteromonas sp. NBT06-2]|uniref:hypothetical protein n=1 Tax=Pseudoalteromonas sp. NBT06-2 TaxID=2025950 RepID=UPI000BA5BA9F|nr:hypothetical protein [Pseudoalteromonas sp. NBT06-2]PAJ71929.1 hypothetical protein CJF42_24090 [Pseudoalteromonas sp. NBT06-2]
MSAFWNFRVILCEADGDNEALYQIHEVEYNQKGKAINWSETSVAPYGKTLEELQQDVSRQQSAFEKPILKLKRKQRGYELIDVTTGDDAFSEVPVGLVLEQ